MEKQCAHERLSFQSGGFYVMCADCGVMWVAKKRGDNEADHSRRVPPLRNGIPFSCI